MAQGDIKVVQENADGKYDELAGTVDNIDYVPVKYAILNGDIKKRGGLDDVDYQNETESKYG